MASAGNAALVAALSSLSLGPSRGSRGGGVRCFCFRRPLPLRRYVKRATTTFSGISPHRRCPPSSTASQVKARKREPVFPLDEEEEEPPFDPVPRPEGYVPPPSIDEVEESEFEVGVAYEKMYGPAYSGETFLGGDIHVMDAKAKKDEGMFGSSEVKRERPKDGMEERVVQVRRVTKVVKGGKQLGFRAVVVVGDKAGTVGVGIGQAREVTDAVEKATINARRELVTIPVTKYSTFPHRSEGKYGAAKVMLRPASPGSGVIAGGAVRAVLEMAGIQNGLGKQLGSENALNNARATLVAVRKMWQFREVAEVRGIPMEELWK